MEAQQTDAFCVELAKRVAHKTAKAFFQNESHGLCRRAPYGDQLVIPESLRERILTLEHHATVSAHPGMNRMYYAMASVLLAIHGHGYLQHYYQVYHLCPKPAVTTTTHVANDAVPSYGTIDRPIGRYLRAYSRYQSW